MESLELFLDKLIAIEEDSEEQAERFTFICSIGCKMAEELGEDSKNLQ